MGVKYCIWSTECTSCKTGRVLLFVKNGIAKCDNCYQSFKTDSEDHPELKDYPVEYWLTEKRDFMIGDLVYLPRGETGKIVKINTSTLDWFPYKVKIRRAVFNRTNQIIEFKSTQLHLII